MSKAQRSLSQALISIGTSRAFLYSESITESLDELVTYRLREEVDDLLNGIKVSLEILSTKEEGSDD